MWRGCVGGMVCFDRKRESLPIFCIFQMFDLCNHCKNVQLSKCAIREKCAIFSNSSFPVFLNCSRESREVPEFIVPTLIEKNTNFFG